MPDESIEQERSKLESKDRAELVAIAEALGDKPASRAKKADIVESILRLTGVVTDDETGGADTDTDTTDTIADATATDDAAEESRNGSAPPAEDDGSEDAEGTGSTQDDDEDDEGNRRRRGRRRGRNRDDDAQWEGEPVEVAGFLDLRDEGYGFLRVKGYLPSREDVYISAKMVRQNGLRKGDHVTGAYRPAGGREKNPALLRVDRVMDADPEDARRRPRFDELTPVHPNRRIPLADLELEGDLTPQVIDLLAPMGLGQRTLIVAPSRSGATTVLSTVAQAIEASVPEAHVMVVAVDERPEEVTGFARLTRGEVISSTFDRPPEEHTHIVELTLERARRLIELGQDVVILLDGLTRLIRAYSQTGQSSGRTLPGGLDASALFPPKRFLGAARAFEEGGSLTIVATLRHDGGSAADDLVWAEFGGVANSEIWLNRRAAEWQLFPALDVERTSTRHVEELVGAEAADRLRALRRRLTELNDEGSSMTGLEWLLGQLGEHDQAAVLANAAGAS